MDRLKSHLPRAQDDNHVDRVSQVESRIPEPEQMHCSNPRDGVPRGDADDHAHDEDVGKTTGTRKVSRNIPADRSGRERLERLMRIYFDVAWRFAHRLLSQKADAEDVAQLAMCILASHLDQVSEGKEKAFLITTTLHLADKVRRQKLRRRETFDQELSEFVVQENQVDENTDLQHARRQLDRILAELPEELRTIFVLFEIEGFSRSEIAEMLQIPEGTVASRIRRAKAEFMRIAFRLKILPRGSKW